MAKLGSVEFQSAFKTYDPLDRLREFADGHVLTGTDIERPLSFVAYHQVDAGRSHVVHVEEFAAGGAVSPDHYRRAVILLCLVELTDQCR